LKRILRAAAIVLAAAAPGHALANVKLAEAKQCLQCHAGDRHTIGPSFQTIQALYKTMKKPEARLIAVMRDGSDANLGPHWGSARMPNGDERPRISDREARQLARWILRGAPGASRP
jgi:cytochrome c